MKKNKAVFLDRDGTINVDKHYLYKIEEFEFLPGAIEGMRALQEAGYLLIVVTNQSGIGRGYYTEEEFHKLNVWMIESLERQGVHITAVYYCPHLPDAAVPEYRQECNCRKPKLGMYYQAAKDWNIDFAQSIAIGDNLRDCAICQAEAARSASSGFLIRSDFDQMTKNNVAIVKNWKKILNKLEEGYCDQKCKN